MDLWLVDKKGNVLKEWKDVDKDIFEFTFTMLEPMIGEDIACTIKELKNKNKKEDQFKKKLKKRFPLKDELNKPDMRLIK